MIPTSKVTPLILPHKPRRWYRRRGWQILLGLVFLFGIWLFWSVAKVNEEAAFLRSIIENPNCDADCYAPSWIEETANYTWFPKSLSSWLIKRFQQPIKIGAYQSRSNEPCPDELLDGLANRTWPRLVCFQCEGFPLWDGTRLRVPLHCPELNQLDLNGCGIDDAALTKMLPYITKLSRLSLDHNPIQGKGLKLIYLCTELETLSLSGTPICLKEIRNVNSPLL